jgi:3-hydroxymyristoyl/3-hydroxydecanoyl-(acyl carrier protein) dehydratase
MHSLDFQSRPVAGVVSSVIFSGMARPGDTLLLESFIDELDDKAVSYHSIATVEGRDVLRVEGALGPLLPMESFIDQNTVRAQFDALFQDAPAGLSQGTSPIASRWLHCDEVVAETPGESVSASLYVDPDAPWFADHFPRKPVLPMTILLECMSNLAREFLARNQLHGYRLQEVRKIKMNTFVEPGSTLLVEVRQKASGPDERVLVLRSDRDGRRVCVCEMRFAATGG